MVHRDFATPRNFALASACVQYTTRQPREMTLLAVLRSLFLSFCLSFSPDSLTLQRVTATTSEQDMYAIEMVFYSECSSFLVSSDAIPQCSAPFLKL